MRQLFVSNGHGEAAIAARLARELRSQRPGVRTDHLALVGQSVSPPDFLDVGPRRAMPSGGLVAMGNMPAITSDIQAGLLQLSLAQYRFLQARGHVYDRVVAVGDVYALLAALFAGRPTTFVGTAKSLYVAPYGPMERLALRRAEAVFVRDEPTAAWLRERGVDARAPGNVIVDLLDEGAPLPAPAPPMIALFPGSRRSAYPDAINLAAVARWVLHVRRDYTAMLSVAPTLSVPRITQLLAENGWQLEDDPLFAFRARSGAAVLHGCTGEIAPLLRLASLVVGQAGTGNEAAAAAGVPVIALTSGRRIGWYRMRQGRLLGDALRIVDREPILAARAVLEVLDSPLVRNRMSVVGRERMGPPGGAAAIARFLAQDLPHDSR